MNVLQVVMYRNIRASVIIIQVTTAPQDIGTSRLQWFSTGVHLTASDYKQQYQETNRDFIIGIISQIHGQRQGITQQFSVFLIRARIHRITT